MCVIFLLLEQEQGRHILLDTLYDAVEIPRADSYLIKGYQAEKDLPLSDDVKLIEDGLVFLAPINHDSVIVTGLHSTTSATLSSPTSFSSPVFMSFTFTTPRDSSSGATMTTLPTPILSA